MRDLAIVLLMGQVGLRRDDVARLQVQDIDARSRTLRIRRGKSRRESELPLTDEAREAVLRYVRHGRPAVSTSAVFITHAFPYDTGVTAQAVTAVVERAFKKARIVHLIAATSDLTPTRGLRPWTYRTLFGLLAATGLRVGEALALDRSDIDGARGTLLVRRDKSRSSREIPLHASVLVALDAYRARRDARHPAPRAAAFFLTESRGTRLQYPIVNNAFRELRRALGWSQCPLPTVHDLRHTFAVRKFLEWFREGKDVDAEMPALSAYMGHKTPDSTYWNLSAVPELLYLVTGHTERFSAVRPPRPDA